MQQLIQLMVNSRIQISLDGYFICTDTVQCSYYAGLMHMLANLHMHLSTAQRSVVYGDSPTQFIRRLKDNVEIF